MQDLNKSFEIANALDEINEYLKQQNKIDKYNSLLRAYKTNDLSIEQVNYLRERGITSNIEKRLQLTINSINKYRSLHTIYFTVNFIVFMFVKLFFIIIKYSSFLGDCIANKFNKIFIES